MNENTIKIRDALRKAGAELVEDYPPIATDNGINQYLERWYHPNAGAILLYFTTGRSDLVEVCLSIDNENSMPNTLARIAALDDLP